MSRVTTKPTYEFATSMDPDQPGIRAVWSGSMLFAYQLYYK
jgi:hypothetical protein